MNDVIDKNAEAFLKEREAIEQFRKNNYPKPALTADIAAFDHEQIIADAVRCLQEKRKI